MCLCDQNGCNEHHCDTKMCDCAFADPDHCIKVDPDGKFFFVYFFPNFFFVILTLLPFDEFIISIEYLKNWKFGCSCHLILKTVTFSTKLDYYCSIPNLKFEIHINELQFWFFFQLHQSVVDIAKVTIV